MTQSSTRAGAEELRRLRALRDDAPVWQDPQTGIWHLLRYADVDAALSDYGRLASDVSPVFPDAPPVLDGHIGAMDPPRHRRLRSLVSREFAPRVIARLEGRIAAITADLLDRVAGQDEVELVGALAHPLPMIVIAELLGVPVADREQFAVWADTLFEQGVFDPSDEERMAASAANMRTFHAYLADLTQERRRHPREDLISALTTTQEGDDTLGDAEITGFATFLLLAGHITSSLVIANTVLGLDELPELQDALRADHSLIPTAVEEVMRYRTPIRAVPRLATTDIDYGGVTVPEGSLVYLSLESANHDERVFAGPDRCVPDRDPNPHLSFGRGVHFCLGAPLARLETRVATRLLLERYSSLRVVPGSTPEQHPEGHLNGVRTLRVEVERAR
ncbi:cytochrome P450 [Lentzea sp. NPDC060358]|uniref:cytochrome P450 n=1 Tax=Lentzea sp. NPDC060358 TaxID=3347103 RepID=UPI0036598331